MDNNELPTEVPDDPAVPRFVEGLQSSTSPTDHGRRKAKEEKTRFGTIADLEASDSSDDDDAQAYYAGGSKHSGQQVLGPPSRKKDIIADILKSAQQIGTEVVDPAKPSSSSGRESFSGTGYRLGQSESDSQIVRSASRSRDDSGSTLVTLKLWKEGFNLNDGPLREYDDPENKQFLDSVRQGLIPPESISVGNSVVQLNLEDHHHESFASFRAPKIIQFSGQGYVLGRPTPAIVRTEAEEEEEPRRRNGVVKTSFEIDDTKPKTSIAIRLPDGTRLKGVFNHTHTVGDIRAFISHSHPEFDERDYYLQTTIPIQELKDDSVTVVKADLINSVLIMKLTK